MGCKVLENGDKLGVEYRFNRNIMGCKEMLVTQQTK